MLSQSGAQKLLSACSSDLYYGHVDGELLRCSVTNDDLAHLSENSELALIIRKHYNLQNMSAFGILKAYVVSFPLVRHRGTSIVRDAEVSSYRSKHNDLSFGN
jgi:hypothetical protein